MEVIPTLLDTLGALLIPQGPLIQATLAPVGLVGTQDTSPILMGGIMGIEVSFCLYWLSVIGTKLGKQNKI